MRKIIDRFWTFHGKHPRQAAFTVLGACLMVGLILDYLLGLAALAIWPSMIQSSIPALGRTLMAGFLGGLFILFLAIAVVTGRVFYRVLFDKSLDK